MIYSGKYKSQDCIILESDNLLVKVLPQFGGKIQSILNKKNNREFLYQSPWKEFKVAGFDESFGNGEMSGIDEMFPAIVEGSYPSFPWDGVKIADHGEVWSLPWNYRIEEDTLVLSVHGVRFPYWIEKRINFTHSNILRTEYKALNNSLFDFKFIWAAHPLFNCSEHTRIILPQGEKKIINVVEGSTVLGEYSSVHPWPITKTPEGEDCDLSRIQPFTVRKSEKFYFEDKVTDGWCALLDEESGDIVALSFPKEQVPYLGFWINQGAFADQYNVAPEPCTGSHDRLDIADKLGKLSILKAEEEYKWYLNITIGNSLVPLKSVDQKGNINI